MSPSPITAADMLEIQFRKASKKGHIHNANLRPGYSHPMLAADDPPVLEVVDRRGQGVFFTCRGLTIPGHGFVRYDDIDRAHWMRQELSRARKQEEFDRIELRLRDGTAVKLVDLDQAVFPLLKFFDWLIQQRNRAARKST